MRSLGVMSAADMARMAAASAAAAAQQRHDEEQAIMKVDPELAKQLKELEGSSYQLSMKIREREKELIAVQKAARPAADQKRQVWILGGAAALAAVIIFWPRGSR